MNGVLDVSPLSYSRRSGTVCSILNLWLLISNTVESTSDIVVDVRPKYQYIGSLNCRKYAKMFSSSHLCTHYFSATSVFHG